MKTFFSFCPAVLLGLLIPAAVLGQANLPGSPGFSAGSVSGPGGGGGSGPYSPTSFTANNILVGNGTGPILASGATVTNSGNTLTLADGTNLVGNGTTLSVGNTNENVALATGTGTLMFNVGGSTRASVTTAGLNVIGSVSSTLPMKPGGLVRVTTPFTATSNAVLANVTGLSVTVAAGQTYKFVAYIPTTATSGGGVQAAISGTATATTITYEGLLFQPVTGFVNETRAAALGTAVCSSATTTTGFMQIYGAITVNASGTLTVQFAQNTSNGAASTVLTDATFEVTQTSN